MAMALNTIPIRSRSLTLGVPLDRVVLFRLMNPKAPISREDALQSAVCQKASSLRENLKLLIEDEDYTQWPKLDEIDENHEDHDDGNNESNGNDEGRIEFWQRYCIALVDHMLDKDKTAAFHWMLQGYEMATPKNRVNAVAHRYIHSATLAHRLLVGHSKPLSFSMLESRIQFLGHELSEDVTDLYISNHLVLQSLQRLSDLERSQFVKVVTGSSRLRTSALSTPISISWYTRSEDLDDIHADAIVHTCHHLLHLPLTRDAFEIEAMIQSLLLGSDGNQDGFNTA